MGHSMNPFSVTYDEIPQLGFRALAEAGELPARIGSGESR
jgi:hypothetical protein